MTKASFCLDLFKGVRRPHQATLCALAIALAFAFLLLYQKVYVMVHKYRDVRRTVQAMHCPEANSDSV